MLMNRAVIRSFPKFVRHVSVQLPRLARDATLLAALRQFSGMAPEALLRGALRWGGLPRVEVKFLAPSPAPGGGVRIPTGGYTNHTDTITLNKTLVDEFEKGGGRLPTARRGHVALVEVILLHELTHWAKEQVQAEDSENHDEGFAFEEAFYGAVVQ
jgi:Metallopeptidase toxin 3